MIGISISTRNRPNVLYICLKHLFAFSKSAFKVYVIDDNSDDGGEANREAIKNLRDKGMLVNYHYNNERLGIAKTKNVGISKLAGCDFYFLMDDDVLVLRGNWWKGCIRAYLKTKNHHFQYIVDGSLNGHMKKKESKDGVDIFKSGSGCMLFFTKQAIEKSGGFNNNYGIYGHEHNGTSIKIHNKGLTPYGIYLVPSDAKKHFHSIDMQGVPVQYKEIISKFESSMTQQDRGIALSDPRTQQAYMEDTQNVK